MPPHRLYWLLGLVAAIALPIAIIGANVRLAFHSMPLYTYAIDRFDTPFRTGLSREELMEASRAIIAYFNSDQDLITHAVMTPSGRMEPLFSEPEALHFRDVRGLLNGFLTLQAAAAFLVLTGVAAAVGAVLAKRRDLAAQALRPIRASTLATVAAILGVGLIAALGGFNALFLQFHLLSFSNDLWMGDAGDRMIQMFPQELFFEGTLMIGAASVLELLLIAGAVTLSLRSFQRGERSSSSTQRRRRAVSSSGGAVKQG